MRLFALIVLLLGAKGGRGGSCDVRKGYQGNPDCKSSESCVPEILNLGECKTVKAQLENPQHDASFFGCQGRKIALKTQYSDAKYLRALPDQHRVNANGTSNDDGIQFEVEDLGALPKGARKIALKSIYGKYLTAKPPAMGPLESYPVSNVTAHSTWLWKGAIFEVKHNANNLYWFKTAWKVESHGRNESRYLLPYTNGYIRGDGTVHDLRRWAKFTPECVEALAQRNASAAMRKSRNGLSYGSRFKTIGAIEDVDSDAATMAINEEGLLSAVQPTIPGGCLKDENMVRVTAKVVFSRKDDLLTYSFREEISFHQTFQHERRKIEVGLNLGGAFDGVSAALGLNFKKTLDTVAANAEYSDIKHGVAQKFMPGFYQIHREITTTVTINGKQATLVEEKFVDAMPKKPEIPIEEWEKEAEERAINYLKDNFGASDSEIDTKGLGASFGQAFCVLATKCAGRVWQDNKETDPNAGGKIAIIGNFESAEECALRVYLEHPEAVGATWWTESAFTCEAIYGTKKLTDTNTHNVQTCIFEGMSNNERNRITLNNGRAESTLIDSDTTGANENLNSTGWTQCMVPYCGSCDIKGRERHVGSYSLAQCKTECLKHNQCKGIDYGILPPNMYQCYFAFEDVKDVGTTFSLTFKAFRKQPCLEGGAGGLGGGYGSKFGSGLQGSAVGLTSMGGGYENDEEAFGGDGMGVGNGMTSGSYTQDEGLDCNKLPILNGESWQKGCPGAVYYESGSPDRTYCDGPKAYPWFKKCCKWENSRCLPKTPADECDKGKAEQLIKVTSETEYFQRSFAAYYESVQNTTWSASYYKEYKGTEVGLTEDAGIEGKFSGHLALDIKKSVGQVSEDMSLSTNIAKDFTVFGGDLQLVRKMTTVISIGGNTMQTEEEIYEYPLPVSQRLSPQDLKEKAMKYMMDTYEPLPSEIPYKNRALFQRSACSFVLPCKPVEAKASQVGKAMPYNYDSPEICAYEVLKNIQNSVGVSYDSHAKKCWMHTDISIPLGKQPGLWRSCHFEGQCPSDYFSCHTCCEPREKDYCKCDKNNGAIPKTLYRPRAEEMYTLEVGVNYGGENIGKCGSYKTRAELETDCTIDYACIGYSTIRDHNTGAVAENGFYPWCLKKTEGQMKIDPSHNYYRKNPRSGAVGSGTPTGGNQLWSPNVETVLKYKSKDLTSMLQNRQQLDQLNVPSPITIEADVKVQAFRDVTLRVKFEHTKFYSQNEEVSVTNAHRILDMINSQNGHSRYGVHIFRTSLEQPMMIQLKNGQAKDVLVSKNELDCVSKIKLMLVKELVRNVENQQLKVVKKESIMKPFDLAPQPKKINLSIE